MVTCLATALWQTLFHWPGHACRAFKDLALDVLWMNLYDLPRIVRCIPSACHVKDMGGGKHVR